MYVAQCTWCIRSRNKRQKGVRAPERGKFKKRKLKKASLLGVKAASAQRCLQEKVTQILPAVYVHRRGI